MTQYVYEIDGELKDRDICDTLAEAKKMAVSDAEDQGHTEFSIVIYELKPVLDGEVCANINWTARK